MWSWKLSIKHLSIHLTSEITVQLKSPVMRSFQIIAKTVGSLPTSAQCIYVNFEWNWAAGPLGVVVLVSRCGCCTHRPPFQSQGHSFLSPTTHYPLQTAHSRVSTMMKTMLSIMTIPKLELKVKYWFESVQRYTERTDLNGQVTDWKFRSLLANYNANLMLHSSFTGCSSLVLMWNGGFCIVGWFNFFCMATLVISVWQLEVNSVVVVFF